MSLYTACLYIPNAISAPGCWFSCEFWQRCSVLPKVFLYLDFLKAILVLKPFVLNSAYVSIFCFTVITHLLSSFPHVLLELWSCSEEGFIKSLKLHSLKSLWEPTEALVRLKISKSANRLLIFFPFWIQLDPLQDACSVHANWSHTWNTFTNCCTLQIAICLLGFVCVCVWGGWGGEGRKQKNVKRYWNFDSCILS